MMIFNFLTNNFRESQFLSKLTPFDTISKIIYSTNLGRGVESLTEIPAGTLLGIYPGKYRTVKDFLEKQEFVEKSVKSSFLFSENLVIDPTDIFGFLPDNPTLRIAFINEPPKGFKANVLPVSSKKHIWYLVIDNINKGDQFFTHYGKSYIRDYEIDVESVHENTLIKSNIKILEESKLKYPWLKSDIEKILNLLE
jgi:hypothetical protein